MRTFVLRDKDILSRVQAFLVSLEGVWEVTVKPYRETRTLAQNRLMWDVLTDISEQVEWHGMRLDPESWKDMVTAALRNQRVVPGLTGGFVVLGQRTSKMSIEEMSEVIDFCYAFGAERGVRFKQDAEAA